MTIELDKTFEVPRYSDVCLWCRHFDHDTWADTGARKCAAFPEGVPAEIWNGENDHTEPYPGDNGTRFERVPGSE